MTRVPVIAVAATAWLALAHVANGQPPPPELTAPVNDFADVIEPAREAELDRLIRALQAASGDVIVVATVKTFEPWADIRMYANEMFENHGRGIGEKGRDNGLLVVLAVDDREVWTEVGYDLESLITDGFAGQTSRQTMVPRFREGDYGGGLLAGVSVYAQRIAEARNVSLENVPVASRRPPADDDFEFPFILLFFLAMFLINGLRGLLYALTGRRRSRRGRRGWYSTVGPFGGGFGGGHRWGGGGGFGGGFGGFGGGRSGGGGGGASW